MDITEKMNNRRHLMISTIFCLAGLLLIAAPAGLHAADSVTVGVLPFFINSPEPLGDLANAIPAMIGSRLEKKGEITVIPQPTLIGAVRTHGWQSIDQDRARRIGKALEADFMVAGTLTKLGAMSSLDVIVFAVDGSREPRRLYVTAADTESVIGKINDLARRLNFLILDKQLVSDIKVTGNRFIEQDAILYAIQTRKGDVFSPELLQEDLKRIYQLGYFKDIQILSTDTDAGKEITFQVVEKPMIKAVQITGNKTIKLEDIQKVMEVKPRTILDLNKVTGDAERIKKLYVDKGYYDAEITYKTTQLDEDYATVDFVIKENEVVKIKKVTFSGNASIPARELRKVIETRPKHWLLSLFTTIGIFKDEALEKDVERLTAYYYSKGFLLARVDKPSVEFKKGDGIYVHFTITEGERFTIGKIDFKGDLIQDPAVLAKKIQSKSGQTFNGKALNDDLVSLKGLYAEKGFAYADISPLTEIKQDEKKVNITFMIDRGEKIYVEEIKITGNTRTRDNVIRRELRLTEGAVYNSEEIKRSKQEVNNLGFFENVNINTEPGSRPNLVKLKVDVKERPTGTFSIGAGYSSVDSLMGMFQISQNNLFGKGQQLTLMAQLGGRSNYYNISFTEPWFRDTRTSVGFDLFNIKREYEDFDRDSSGFMLRTSFPFFRYDFTRYHITYRYESTDIDVVDDDVALELQKQEGKTTVSSITNSIILDSRDDKWKPREGLYLSGSAEVAGLGGDARFLGITASAARWFPLPWDTAFMIRGTIGQLFEMGEDIPVSEKFFLGGLDSLRGFEARSVGPRERRPKEDKTIRLFGTPYTIKRRGKSDEKDVVGGEKELYFNFEYLFPIMKEAGIRGVVFFDTGNAYEKGESFFSDLRHDVGIGVRWYSPFGPLRLEWGKNLSPRDDEKGSNFEFSMGRSF
ncbi:MAG: outer membrane protein assembly factor BamA [Desulfobacterota bacterium]|nr:outer membrane protein assembly factor BamA [Thermodesulfobacteriota bacterium]